MSSLGKLYDFILDSSSLEVFGFTYFVLHPQVECNKLSFRSSVCLFLGYGDGQKGYHYYDLQARRIYVYHHVLFLKHIYFYSVSFDSHITSSLELIYVDPFGINDNIYSDCNFENYKYNSNSNLNINMPFVAMATQQSPTIVDRSYPPSHYPSHDCKL